jgi:hypothetical protein
VFACGVKTFGPELINIAVVKGSERCFADDQTKEGIGKEGIASKCGAMEVGADD